MMNDPVVYRFSAPRIVKMNRRARAFSLVELLTVMFIISALIAILVPSLNAARNSAKKTSTLATQNALASGLEMFRNDNGRQFAPTNGYPPSFAHPRILDASGSAVFSSYQGAFPFVKPHPRASGAHWLVAMLLGADQKGYIKGKTVPKRRDLRYEPWKWYTPDPLGDDTSLARAGFYVDPGGLKTVRTGDLHGRPNFNLITYITYNRGGTFELFKPLPVIVDAFGQPILYYAANANGRPTNMVAGMRSETNHYAGGPQERGPPFYFHQDNDMFTGTARQVGWDFHGSHKIARVGASFRADQLVDPSNTKAQESFARFIVDRRLYRTLVAKATEEREPPSEMTMLRPVNADSYLLISAGADGRYGTSDDIANFPRDVE